MNTIIVLGSGTSTGIPMANGDWGVCNPKNLKNYRTRCSIFLKTDDGAKILVDTSPDLRTQLLSNKIQDIDATIITHDHADHLHGIDDLRPFCFGPPTKSIPIYTYDKCGPILESRFPYIFKNDKRPNIGGGIPRLDLNCVPLNKEFKILGAPFNFFLLPHGHDESMGFFHKSFAYIVDCHEIPDEVIESLKARQLELLIIDCVQSTPHQTHLSTEKCFEYIERIAPKVAGLIHMGNQIDHDDLTSKCQNRFSFPVFPLYDGQELSYT